MGLGAHNLLLRIPVDSSAIEQVAPQGDSSDGRGNGDGRGSGRDQVRLRGNDCDYNRRRDHSRHRDDNDDQDQDTYGRERPRRRSTPSPSHYGSPRDMVGSSPRDEDDGRCFVMVYVRASCIATQAGSDPLVCCMTPAERAKSSGYVRSPSTTHQEGPRQTPTHRDMSGTVLGQPGCRTESD